MNDVGFSYGKLIKTILNKIKIEWILFYPLYQTK